MFVDVEKPTHFTTIEEGDSAKDATQHMQAPPRGCVGVSRRDPCRGTSRHDARGVVQHQPRLKPSDWGQNQRPAASRSGTRPARCDQSCPKDNQTRGLGDRPTAPGWSAASNQVRTRRRGRTRCYSSDSSFGAPMKDPRSGRDSAIAMSVSVRVPSASASTTELTAL